MSNKGNGKPDMLKLLNAIAEAKVGIAASPQQDNPTPDELRRLCKELEKRKFKPGDVITQLTLADGVTRYKYPKKGTPCVVLGYTDGTSSAGMDTDGMHADENLVVGVKFKGGEALAKFAVDGDVFVHYTGPHNYDAQDDEKHHDQAEQKFLFSGNNVPAQ